MKGAVTLIVALVLSTPAAAQMDMSMPGMTMPAKPKPVSKVKSGAPQPASKTATPTAQPAPPLEPAPPTMEVPGPAPAPGMAAQDEMIGAVPAPAPPTDHAADVVFGGPAMASSRHMLRHENGGMSAAGVLINLAEYRVQKGGDGLRWDGEGWLGGDINRLVVKAEGEATIGRSIDSAEAQALFSHAITPYFNLQAGVRHDIRPGPNRTYATLGVEGLAPYWFEVSAALFVSERGDVLARFEGYYDQHLTQRLILQPRVELNLAAQDVPANRIGAGLSDAEVGLRLRYEVTRQVAPYVGVSWDGKVGAAARFARVARDRAQATSVVFGIRTRF